MLKLTRTYEDYNGKERTEDFYFNLTEAEVAEIELSTTGGLGEKIDRLSKSENMPEIIKIFKEIIFKSYGVKSDDGRQLIKSEELSKAFSETPVYSDLFMELATDATKAAEFVNGITPNKKEKNPVPAPTDK